MGGSGRLTKIVVPVMTSTTRPHAALSSLVSNAIKKERNTSMPSREASIR